MSPSLKVRNDKSICDRLSVMWTKEEDDILREQVKLHGIDKWAKVAIHLCGKTSRQCRRRWHMFLNVVNKRGGWSADEDELLLEAHRKFGNRWTEIAKKLPGRTDNAVKNRFCVLCKKQTKEAEVSPLRRPIDSGSDTAKQRLPERRLLEGPRATGSGANKKMRTEANHKRKSEVAVQQRHLEETLQQWKGLQSSEALPCSPDQVSREGSLPPWDSMEFNVLHRNTQADKLQGWMGLAVKGEGRQMQPRDTVSQWNGSQSGAGMNDPICSTSSLGGEARRFTVQSHIPSTASSCSSRFTQENLQEWTRANVGDGTSDQKMLNTSPSTWCSANSTDAANNLLSQQNSDTELLRWWKGLDKNMMSNVVRQYTEVQQALPQWDQNPQDCVSASLNNQNPRDEIIPPLSEMSSLPAAYMSNSKECTILTGMRRWSMVQPGKPGEYVQQSNAGGTQTWDNSLAKEADTITAKTANTRSKENMHEWQDWNSTEVGTYSLGQNYLGLTTLGQNGELEHTMEIDNPKPDDSAESIPLETSVKTLSMSSGSKCQPDGNTVLHRPEGHEIQEWKKSEIPKKNPRQLLEDRLQQLENSQAAVNPGPLVSMLSRFAGSESKSIAHLLGAHAERQGRYKSQFIEESWKTAVEKLKCKPVTFSSSQKTHSPRGVLAFEEFMSGGSKDSDLETAAAAITNPSQTSKADDSIWKSGINVKDGEDGEMSAREGLLPENNRTCEASTDGCGVPNDEVKLMTTEGEASRVTEPPTPDIRTDDAHSPTQIAPRSHLTMECMPSPQFSDSEKEFLLSTLALDQTTTNCWSSSPLRPPSSRFSKVRNPLIDIRYDTPARSPLSSCLLRQFQVSDTPNLA